MFIYDGRSKCTTTSIICNHIKRDITLSLVGIDLFFVVVEGSANRFGTVQGNLVLPIFFTFFL